MRKSAMRIREKYAREEIISYYFQESLRKGIDYNSPVGLYEATLTNEEDGIVADVTIAYEIQ